MTDTFRLTMAQLNPIVGDIPGNRAKALDAWRAGKAAGSDFVALPEMFLVGYQPQDLVLKPAFTADAMAQAAALAAECADGPPLGIGLPWAEDGELFNVYAILSGGRVSGVARKHHLPHYNVFDEPRLFTSGPISGPFGIGALRMGTPICEDAWYDDVTEAMAESGAELLMVPNGSPYRRNKYDVRMNLMVARVVETGLPLAYLNFVGGQDDQVFDGGSFVLNPGGALAVQLPVFEETVAHVDFDRRPDGWHAATGPMATIPDATELDYHAMVLSLRDYFRKTGFIEGAPGPLRRRRQRARGDHRLGRARPGKRPLRHAAVRIHLRAQPRGRRRRRRGPRLPPRHPAHRTRPRRDPGDPRRRSSRAPSPTSPRRTSSPACAACC